MHRIRQLIEAGTPFSFDGHSVFPSLFNLGDEVVFQPIGASRGLRASIVGVTFLAGKVLYDVSLWIDDHYYDVLPLERVDSCFVLALDDPQVLR